MNAQVRIKGVELSPADIQLLWQAVNHFKKYYRKEVINESKNQPSIIRAQHLGDIDNLKYKVETLVQITATHEH